MPVRQLTSRRCRDVVNGVQGSPDAQRLQLAVIVEPERAEVVELGIDPYQVVARAGRSLERTAPFTSGTAVLAMAKQQLVSEGPARWAAVSDRTLDSWTPCTPCDRCHPGTLRSAGTPTGTSRRPGPPCSPRCRRRRRRCRPGCTTRTCHPADSCNVTSSESVLARPRSSDWTPPGGWRVGGEHRQEAARRSRSTGDVHRHGHRRWRDGAVAVVAMHSRDVGVARAASGVRWVRRVSGRVVNRPARGDVTSGMRQATSPAWRDDAQPLPAHRSDD